MLKMGLAPHPVRQPPGPGGGGGAGSPFWSQGGSRGIWFLPPVAGLCIIVTYQRVYKYIYTILSS